MTVVGFLLLFLLFILLSFALTLGGAAAEELVRVIRNLKDRRNRKSPTSFEVQIKNLYPWLDTSNSEIKILTGIAEAELLESHLEKEETKQKWQAITKERDELFQKKDKSFFLDIYLDIIDNIYYNYILNSLGEYCYKVELKGETFKDYFWNDYISGDFEEAFYLLDKETEKMLDCGAAGLQEVCKRANRNFVSKINSKKKNETKIF